MMNGWLARANVELRGAGLDEFRARLLTSWRSTPIVKIFHATPVGVAMAGLTL